MPLHIVVCIKSVVRSAPSGVARRTPENSELNIFDRPALEAALQLKAAAGGRVTVLTMGPPVAREALAEAQAMGADRAVLINHRALAGSDTLVTARVLAAAIALQAPYDLLLFGARTSDSDTGQVGAQTAAVLQLPLVSGVKSILPDEQGFQVVRLMDDWEEHWRAASPSAMTIHPRAYAPRPIGLIGISEAYDDGQAAVETLDLSALGLTEAQVGLNGSPTRVATLQMIKRRRTGEMISGDPQQQIAELMQRLKQRGAL